MEKELTNPNNGSDELKDNEDVTKNLKLQLEIKEKELNEREFKANFDENILKDLKKLDIEESKELKDSLIKIINFKDKDSFDNSYNNAIQILKNVKFISKNPSYSPRVGKGRFDNDFIKKAFKPPKLY